MHSEIGNPTLPHFCAPIGERMTAVEKDMAYLQRQTANDRAEIKQEIRDLSSRTTKLEARSVKLLIAGMFFLASLATHGPSIDLLKPLLAIVLR